MDTFHFFRAGRNFLYFATPPILNQHLATFRLRPQGAGSMCKKKHFGKAQYLIGQKGPASWHVNLLTESAFALEKRDYLCFKDDINSLPMGADGISCQQRERAALIKFGNVTLVSCRI